MVCKEEVLRWFKDLDSYERIDVMYQLLNMCLPFEVHFLGSCTEELGKRTFHVLRGPSLNANDFEKLSKDTSLNQGILEETVRHRVLVYLSLLSSRNYSVASWLYKQLLRTEAIEEYIVKEQGIDETLHSEFLLLYTMALYHPAFTFEQKQFFSKIVLGLNDIKEHRASAKHIALGYPPGFGYPTYKGYEVPNIPVKMTSTSTGESPATFHQPPGLPPVPPVPYFDILVPMWSRPGFPCGAPEVSSFPNTVSPLVSRTASPNQSRSTSPHRTTPGGVPPPPLARLQPLQTAPQSGPPPHLQPPPSINGPPPPTMMNGPPPQPSQVDVMSPPQQVPHEPHLQSSLPPPQVFVPTADVKAMEDGDSSKMEEKHLYWHPPTHMIPDIKPNGFRFPSIFGKVRPYIVEQMKDLNLDGENSLHHSNSSSNSSPAETPPGTPSTTPATTPHGPGRGDKSRPNGIPPFQGTAAPLMPDTTSPPPPQFTTNSVPYSFPQPFATMPPNRSMFHFNQAYRPTFTAHYPNFPTESFPTYTFPYPPLIFSSPYQQQHRTPPGCYNCGSQSHIGSECTSQNVEEITQKKAYQLEYEDSA